jgi:hypothetical protein
MIKNIAHFYHNVKLIQYVSNKNQCFLWSIEKINLKFKEKFGSYAKVSTRISAAPAKEADAKNKAKANEKHTILFFISAPFFL